MPVEEELRIQVELLTGQVSSQAKDIQNILNRLNDEASKPIGKVGLVEYLEGSTERARDLSQQLDIASQRIQGYADAVNSFNRAALDSFADYETAVASVRTLSQDADNLVVSIEALVEEQDFLVSRTAAVNSAYQILSANFTDTNEVLEILRQSTLLAKGGFSDVETSVDAVTSILSAYKLEVSEAAAVTDSLIATQNVGKLRVGEYAAQIGNIVGIADLAGVSLYEVNGAVAALTKNGVPLSTAISGIRQALINVIKPTSQAQEVADRLKIAFNAQALESKGLVGVLEEISAKSTDLTTDLSGLFTDIDSFNVVSQLAGAGLEGFKADIEAVGTAAGVTADQVEILTDTISSDFEKTANRIDSVLTDLGKDVANGIKPAAEAFLAFLEFIDSLPDGVKAFIAQALLAIGVILTLAAAATGLAAIAPALATGFTAAAAAVKFFAVGVSVANASVATLIATTAIVAGIIVAAFAVGNLIKFTNELRTANIELDEFQKQLERTGNANFQLATDLKNANDRVNESREQGIALTENEIEANERLARQGRLRLERLKEELAVAKSLPAANKEQAQARANLVAQLETQIRVLESNTTALENNIKTTKEAAQTNTDEYVSSLEEIEKAEKARAEAQQKAFDALQAASQRASLILETELQNQVNARKQAGLDAQEEVEKTEEAIAQIELDYANRRIGRIKEEIAETIRQRDAAIISAEAGGQRLLELEGELASATKTRIDQQQKLQEQADKAAEAAAKQLIEERVTALKQESDEIAKQNELYHQQLDIRRDQLELAQTQLDADLTASELTVNGLEEALRLKEQLANLDPKLKENAEQRALIEERLGELGVSSGTKRLEIEQRIADENKRRRELETRAFEAQQKADALALEAQVQQNLRTAEREIIEARIRVIKAGDNEEEVRAAQELLDLAVESQGALQLQVEIQREILRTQQASARESFEAAQSAAEFNDEMRLAQARAKELVGDTGKLAGNLDGATSSARGLTSALSSARSELSGVNRETEILKTNFEEAAQRLRDMSIASEDLKKNIRELANINTPEEAAARNQAIAEQNQALFDQINANRGSGVGIGFGPGRSLGKGTIVDGLNGSLFGTFLEEQQRQDKIKQGLLDGAGGPKRVGDFGETTLRFKEAEALKKSIQEVLAEADKLTRQAERSAEAAIGSSFGRDRRLAGSQELIDRRDELTRIAQAQADELGKLLPSAQFFEVQADLRQSLNKLDASFNGAELADLLRQIRDGSLGETNIVVERQEDTTIAADIDAAFQRRRVSRAGA
jgi:TP901 family phage tail tape measure protein